METQGDLVCGTNGWERVGVAALPTGEGGLGIILHEFFVGIGYNAAAPGAIVATLMKASLLSQSLYPKTRRVSFW